MPLLRQPEFAFQTVVGEALRLPNSHAATAAVALQLRGRDVELEQIARDLLRALGATRIATDLRVEWNSRLRTTAGRADYRQKLISLNPQLIKHPAEINRTLRHELAHILAQFRARRRRILPHGIEWREVCHDLEISDEKRCHNLPFPARTYAARFVYRCPHCRQEFPRVRRVHGAVACLACCRKHNAGKFDARFRLQRIK